MCGLFGAYWQNPNPSMEEMAQRAVILTVLAVEMESRGSQSYGIWHSGGIDGTIVKDTGAISRRSMVGFCKSRMIIGHTRFATQGAITRDNAHPFRIGPIIGAHNGVVYNHATLNAKHSRNHAVDSIHLVSHIARGLPMDDIDSYGALLWFNAEDPRTLNAGRWQGGELAVAKTSLGTVIASTRAAIVQATTLAGIEVKSWYTLDERHHYAITSTRVDMVKADKFTCSRTSTRSWQSGFATGTGKSAARKATVADMWDFDDMDYRAPISRTATDSDDVDDDDPTNEDRAIVYGLAIQFGATKNDARRAWSADFDPLDPEDDMYWIDGEPSEELYSAVIDEIDPYLWGWIDDDAIAYG